tara:strand:- start:218 stop:484 length:267 start_codon:yes stop_codon:yes gene_type:complete
MGKIEDRAGVIFSIITTLVFCGAAFGVAQSQINHNRSAIEEYKQDHDILLNVQADVRWMRSRMARDDRLGVGVRFGPIQGNNPSQGTR